MAITWLDAIGYAASVVILVSLTMSSIVRLRWINMAGAVMFSVFGYLIGSIPTGTLNLGIVFIDIYYLVKLYRARDELAIVEADLDSGYFQHFWNVNQSEITGLFGDAAPRPDQRAFYFLRNNNTAGILLGHERSGGAFRIDIDYVTPEYRDLKIGQHFMGEARIAEVLPGITTLQALAHGGTHGTYLRKLGFLPAAEEPGLLVKKL